MGIGVKILKQHALMVATISGRFDAEDAHATITRMQSDPEFVWNLDRLIFLDDRTDLSDLDLGKLLAIKDDIIKTYFGGKMPNPSELPAYRMAFVCPDKGNATIMKLFGRIWDSNQTPFVNVQLFDSAAAALAWLGREFIPENELRGETPTR